eukprot:COSAG02_NODE_1097_length_14589_cov_6.159075_7_plen_590_part_00
MMSVPATGKEPPGSCRVSFRMPARDVSTREWEELWAQLQKEGWELLKHGEQRRSHYLLPDGHDAPYRVGSYVRRLTARDGSKREVYRTRGEVMHHAASKTECTKTVAAPTKNASFGLNNSLDMSVHATDGIDAHNSFKDGEWSSDDLQNVTDLPSCPTVLEDVANCTGGAAQSESTRLGDAGWGPRARDKVGLSRWSPRADRDWIKENRQTDSPARLECRYTLPAAGSMQQVLPLPSLDMPGDPVLHVLPESQQIRSEHHTETRESVDADRCENSMLCADNQVPMSDLQRWVPPNVRQAVGSSSRLAAHAATMATDGRDNNETGRINLSAGNNDTKAKSANNWTPSDIEEVDLPRRQQALAQIPLQPSPDRVSTLVVGKARKSAMGFLHHDRPGSSRAKLTKETKRPVRASSTVPVPPEKRQKVVQTIHDSTRSHDSATADIVANRVPVMRDATRCTFTQTSEKGTVGATPVGVVYAEAKPKGLPDQLLTRSGGGTTKCQPQRLSSPRRRNYPQPKPRQVWTEEEHKAFTDALQCYGRNWIRVAQSVGTKTVEQTRSHAQKYFRRLQRAGMVGLIPPPRRPTRCIHPSK